MKKLIKITLVLFMVMSLTGCTQQLKTNDNKPVTYSGKTLTLNILCQPTNVDVIAKYKANKVNLKELPKCNEFKISDGGYEGIWTSLFIKPLAWLILKLNYLLGSVGLAIIIISVAIRMLIYPITQKTAKQSQNMKKAQPELDKLEKKYKGKTDRDSTMQKSQEMMGIYKQYGINPMAGCLFGLIQLPIFFAFLEAINRVPAIFEGKFLTLDLGTTTWSGLTNGHFGYIVIVILIIASTYYTFKNAATTGNVEQQKQMQFITKFMMIFISFVSFTLPTAVAVYWITSSVITIIQNKLVKRSAEHEITRV